MVNNDNIQPVADDSQIVLYQPNESVKLEVKVDSGHETVWLTQQQIADLFGTKRPAITKHLGNIFKSGELDQNSVSSILEHTLVSMCEIYLKKENCRKIQFGQNLPTLPQTAKHIRLIIII